MKFVLPMYNVHPYFSVKNLGKKSVQYTWQNTVCHTLNEYIFINFMFLSPRKWFTLWFTLSSIHCFKEITLCMFTKPMFSNSLI